MDKIPAACAMEWSIELERGLRSKRPGQPIEAIEQIGSKLQKWSSEPWITMAVSKMYGLVPGEDRTFANTILLRLADAFKSGDNCLRRSIIKVFLLEWRHIRKKGKPYDGILAKQRVPNYSELLKRVKAVYETGDVESRALSLRLFGCWAHLAKDSADVHYMIISSLLSCHILEVKASLFSAGCLCVLSEDFACIVLGILVRIISSMKASSDVKLEAARVFSMMQCSSLIANRAYKAGKKLVLDSPAEEFVHEMLPSLSKLAFKSSGLISKQVDFLISFLSSECSSVKAMSLKCLCFLSSGGACRFPVNWNMLTTLFHKIDDTDLPINLQCKAIHLLQKIFSFGVPELPFMDMPEFFKLVLTVESVAQTPIILKRLAALGLLVDIACFLKIKMRQGWFSCPEHWSFAFLPSIERSQPVSLPPDGNGPAHFACHVASSVIDEIKSLTNHMNIKSGGMMVMEEQGSFVVASKVKQNFRSLSGLLLHLLEEYPALGVMTLNRTRYVIEDLVTMQYTFSWGTSDTRGKASQVELNARNKRHACTFPESDEKTLVSEVVLCICRFTDACLKKLDEANAVTLEVYTAVKLLIDCVNRSGFCNYDTCEVFYVRLHSDIMWHSCRIEFTETKDGANLSSFHDDFWVDNEWLALEFAKKMMTRGSYWAAYRAGKYLTCEGMWFAATFTFRKLMDRVQSDSSSNWLRSLMLLAGAESEIKLLLYPKLGIQLINGLRTNNDGRPCSEVEGEVGLYVDENANLRDYGAKLANVYKRLCLSEEILAASGTLKCSFYFQRWFLSLRANVLEILVDMLGVLGSHEYFVSNLDSNETGRRIVGINYPVLAEHMHPLACKFACFSFCLKKIAREYDLLATSFMDIDLESSRSISTLALNCSLLAFCTAFLLGFLNLSAYENVMAHSLRVDKSSYLVLIQDLIERLHDVDNKSTVDLQRLFTVHGKLCGRIQSRTHVTCSGHKERASILFCRFAISGVLGIHEKAKGVKDEDSLCRIFREGLQFLSEIVRKWMELPFRTPKYYFRVRPCIAAELFIFSADAKSPEKISVASGFQLSLNLCIQLRNALPERRVAKMYCILAARSSDTSSGGSKEREIGEQSGFDPRKTDEMVDLNEKLLQYINNNMKKPDRMDAENTSWDDWVTTCVCFEANERGQGFSNCLLDVSAFLEGTYQVKWHCCCIDANGSYWSLLPLNTATIFRVKKQDAAS